MNEQYITFIYLSIAGITTIFFLVKYIKETRKYQLTPTFFSIPYGAIFGLLWPFILVNWALDKFIDRR